MLNGANFTPKMKFFSSPKGCFCSNESGNATAAEGQIKAISLGQSAPLRPFNLHFNSTHKSLQQFESSRVLFSVRHDYTLGSDMNLFILVSCIPLDMDVGVRH